MHGKLKIEDLISIKRFFFFFLHILACLEPKINFESLNARLYIFLIRSVVKFQFFFQSHFSIPSFLITKKQYWHHSPSKYLNSFSINIVPFPVFSHIYSLFPFHDHCFEYYLAKLPAQTFLYAWTPKQDSPDIDYPTAPSSSHLHHRPNRPHQASFCKTIKPLSAPTALPTQHVRRRQ